MDIWGRRNQALRSAWDLWLQAVSPSPHFKAVKTEVKQGKTNFPGMQKISDDTGTLNPPFFPLGERSSHATPPSLDQADLDAIQIVRSLAVLNLGGFA